MQGNAERRLPPLYLPVESSERELLARLLLGLMACQAGADVVVGVQKHIWDNAAAFPKGVMLFKTMDAVQVANMKRARSLGHFTVALDEEALALSDGQEILRGVAPGISDACNLFLAQSPFHAEVLGQVCTDKDRIAVVGNPRTDLLRPELRSCATGDVDEIREKFGNFVLVNTNSGSVNSGWGSMHRYMQITENVGRRDYRNQEHVFRQLNGLVWEMENMQALARFVRDLRERSDIHIVVRPHPSENADVWEMLMRPFENVTISGEGAGSTVIAASECVVQTGCTTGTEALLMDKPVVTLKGAHNPLHDMILTYDITPVFESSAEAAEVVSKLVDGNESDLDTLIPEKQRERYFSGMTGKMASYRIIRRLLDEDLSSQHLGEWDPRGDVVQASNVEYLKRKGKFSGGDVRNHMTSFMSHLPFQKTVKVDKLGEGLFLLQPQ